MTVARRRILGLLGAAVAAPAVLRVTRANAAEVTLRLHHFLPPSTTGQAKFFVPWSKQIEQESGGRIKIDIFPSMSLGGTPPQLYDQAKDGVVDLVWTLPGYTPGRFPSIEVFELPFVASRRALVNSKAVQDFSETHLQADLREVKPICVWAHDHGLIHSNRQVKTLEDLKGLKLRFPTRWAGEALKALGASAIGMPVPQVPESLAQRVIDGAVLPWEVVPGIKVHELVKFHTEIPGSPTFYTATFVLVMNRAKYESLAPDLRAIMDKHSGQAAATIAGQAWDDATEPAAELARKRGNTFYTLPEEEVARWRKVTEPVIQTWLAQMKDRGLNGAEILDAAKAALAKYEAA